MKNDNINVYCEQLSIPINNDEENEIKLSRKIFARSEWQNFVLTATKAGQKRYCCIFISFV